MLNNYLASFGLQLFYIICQQESRWIVIVGWLSFYSILIPHYLSQNLKAASHCNLKLYNFIDSLLVSSVLPSLFSKSQARWAQTWGWFFRSTSSTSMSHHFLIWPVWLWYLVYRIKDFFIHLKKLREV